MARILVVTSDDGVGALLVRGLGDKHTVMRAKNVRTAQERIAADHPELIIMSLDDTKTTLKFVKGVQPTPVIVMTGWDPARVPSDELRACGVRAIVYHPFTADTMKRAVNVALRTTPTA